MFEGRRGFETKKEELQSAGGRKPLREGPAMTPEEREEERRANIEQLKYKHVRPPKLTPEELQAHEKMSERKGAFLAKASRKRYRL